ncbi:hypothetical protein CEY15_17155 [Dietzia natronolimnaea]|uniref:NodB homology domain-containing protein n=2 Tax=Dietzia natronolimnaea TaxID=161920 RepID=A0A2A2WKP0_9ACTN|nr:hypothetical protein CEY15_17155 [Dietzia natronolimnaea]
MSIPHVQLPYFHDLPAADEEAFRRIVARIAETHELIPYSDAMQRIDSGNFDRPYAAFSFDDGFISNLRIAKILEDFGTRGMFFVPTEFIGTRTTAEARAFFGFADGVDEGAMSWHDLELLKQRGHEIGNHTSGHKVLSWVSPGEAIDQISSGAEAIRAQLGECHHFAWPRGRYFHMTALAAQAVFDAGHSSCASAERGAHSRREAQPLRDTCIRRNHVLASWPQRHIDFFFASTALQSIGSPDLWPGELQIL